MKKTSKLFLAGALILVLLTAACGADQGATPTLSGTSFSDLTDTPGFDSTGTVGTETTGTAETATTEQVETPTSMATGISTEVATTGTAVTQTPGIPVTGVDVALIECQFCVDTMAHALLVLPDTATFEVVSSTTSTTTSTANDVICSTVEVNNGKQVVLCSGPEMTPITLNICTDANICTDFPLDLLACPLVQNGTAVPTNETPSLSETATSTTPSVVNTPTP